MLKKFQIVAILFLPTFSIFTQTTFRKITVGDIVNDGEISQGCSWVDYDNDGDLDLFVANFGNNFLYRNDGPAGAGGQVIFTPITAGHIVNYPVNSFSCSWGDYDNNGYLDLFVANDGGQNFLYQNDGPAGAGFTRITSGAIVTDVGESKGCSWGDYDNDGNLDLIVANIDYCLMYQNDGDGSFTRITSGEIVTNVAAFNNVSWGDYDNDGDLDLFVTTGLGENNFLYRNDGIADEGGQVTFTRITNGAIVSKVDDSRGNCWGDYDNDGDFDLFVANSGVNFLYQNDGDTAGTGQVTFTRITSGDIVNDTEQSWGCSWGDYDNDGDLDLFVVNGWFGDENNFLYQNDGPAGAGGQVTFTRITEGGIVTDGGPSTGCSWADYNNDGDLDLYVTNWDENNFLYQNDGNSNNWINIKCVGTFSNTSAIGAKVRVRATLSGKPIWQLREISGQTGFCSQNSLNAEFGLGDAAVIDTIKIEWPTGRNQFLTHIAVNQFLTVTEPVPVVVQDTPLSEVGTEIVVTAIDTGDMISGMTLKYRRGGDSTFTATPMSDQGNGSFQGTIPAGVATSTGVEYRIWVTDNAGRTAWAPAQGSYSVRVHVPDGISRGEAQPNGSAQTAYRIFSVPLNLDEKSPAALLLDDLGEYDDTRWRFSEYTGNNTYNEFPEITEIVSGTGYWFLVSEPARVIDTGAGTSNLTSEGFIITLHSGWNLIGNPFNFPIPANNIRLQDGRLAELRAFSGNWNNPVTDPMTGIQPFEGCAVFSDASVTDTLLIDPYIPASTGMLAKRDGSVRENEISWSIQVSAQSQQARDVDNVAGVVFSASENWDQFDLPEPPPIGEYVSVYFSHRNWGKLSKRFCTDFRPEFSHGNAWEFEVETSIRDRVELTFVGLERVPQEFEVWLVDEALNLTRNLRANPRFSIAASEEHPKRLKLLVGKSNFIGENLSDIQTVPTDFELSQNFPNPFNPVTTFQYSLPTTSRTSLKIYNLLGKEVSTLIDGELKEAGYYAIVWDGRNAAGNAVASGTYFIRLQAGDYVQVQKMVKLE